MAMGSSCTVYTLNLHRPTDNFLDSRLFQVLILKEARNHTQPGHLLNGIPFCCRIVLHVLPRILYGDVRTVNDSYDIWYGMRACHIYERESAGYGRYMVNTPRYIKYNCYTPHRSHCPSDMPCCTEPSRL